MKTIYWVSSSHWDREWHRPFEGFRCRLVDMLDRALDCMSKVAGYGFYFLDGQSILLEDYLAVRPEREARLKELIAAGKLAAGPFYVLQDEMVEDGELFVRNLQRGIALARRFGAKEFVGYSPDTFGHCAQLPQLLSLAGVCSAILGRGFAGTQQENLWSAPDGSQVFLIWLPCSYGGFAHHDCLAEGRRIPENRAEALALFEQRFAQLRPFVKSVHALVLDGADHGFADPNEVRLAADFNAKYPGGPRFEIASLPEAARRIAEASDPSRVAGEMRAPADRSSGWILSGTYSTRMPLKIGLSTLTRQLLALEKLLTLRRYSPLVQTQIDRAWQLLLQNIPHDSICGCHVDEVYLENLTRLNSARSIVAHLFETTLGTFVPPSATTACNATVLFYDPAPNAELFKPFTGECPYPCIAEPQRVVLAAEGIEFVLSRVERYWTNNSHLTTYRLRGFYRNRTGANVFDAALRPDHVRSAPPEAAALPLLTFVDSGDAGDTYSYSPPARDEVVCSTGTPGQITTRQLSDRLLQTHAEVVLTVPASLTADRQARSEKQTDLRIRYELTRDRMADVTWITGIVHNTARDHRLRIVFPTPAADTHSFSGAPFAIERRPVKIKFNAEEFSERPLADYPFVDYIRYGGLSVYSESNGEYQITDRGIEVTLCRCVGWLGRPDLAYRRGQAGPYYETPQAQLLETDIPFAFVSAPSLADPAADYCRKEWLSQTITHCVLSESLPAIRARWPVRVEGAELSALRWLSEREIEVRLFNPQAGPATVHLRADQSLSELWEVNLNHQRIPTGWSCPHPQAATLTIRPYQILTLRGATDTGET